MAVSVSLFSDCQVSHGTCFVRFCEVLHVMDVRVINVWEDVEGDFSLRHRIFRLNL